jgi:hypothetical protein
MESCALSIAPAKVGGGFTVPSSLLGVLKLSSLSSSSSSSSSCTSIVAFNPPPLFLFLEGFLLAFRELSEKLPSLTDLIRDSAQLIDKYLEKICFFSQLKITNYAVTLHNNICQHLQTYPHLTGDLLVTSS